MGIKLKSKIFIISVVFFVFLWSAIFFYIRNRYLETLNLVLDNSVKNQEYIFNSIITSFVRIEFFYFNFIIDNKVIKILKQAKKDENLARGQLYSYLLPFYNNFKKIFRKIELHFHDSNCRSFLRFYSPYEFGDDLSKAREDIVFVKNNRKPIYGFITGKIFSGFRYTFPIVDTEQNFLGSVDISIPYDFFLDIYSEIEPSTSFNIVLKKDRIYSKISEKYKNYFIKSILGSDWLEIKDTVYNSLNSKSICQEIFKWKNLNKFLGKSVPLGFVYINSLKDFYKVVILPLKNFNKEIEGYLLIVEKGDDIKGIHIAYYKNLFIFTLLLCVTFILVIFLNIEIRNVQLEKGKVDLMISFMNVPLYIVDKYGKINLINKKACELLGYSEGELLGKNVHDVLHLSNDTSCVFCEGMEKNSDKFECEFVFKKKNGEELIAEIFAKKLVLKDETLCVVGFYDITQKKLAENMLYISSITDPLTGLYNRKYIKEVLNSEKEKADIYGDIFSVIMLDLDNFKNINDTRGHDAGDEVLKRLSVILKSNLRSSDIVGRWGGDEFIIIMKNTKLKEAVSIAENLRRKIEDLNFDGIKITASMGVSVYKYKSQIKDIILQADYYLYVAKNKGKNLVCF